MYNIDVASANGGTDIYIGKYKQRGMILVSSIIIDNGLIYRLQMEWEVSIKGWVEAGR